MTVGVILLAAGQSQRFGSDKRAVSMGDTSLLETTLTQIREAQLPCVVCLRDDDEHWRQRLSAVFGVATVSCVSAGMGDSLAIAVRSLPDDWQAALVALADMPAIKSATYRTVADTVNQNNIAAPYCDGQRGHPVGFGRAFFGDLAALTGDFGARTVIAQHSAALTKVTVADRGIVMDVDTWADVAKLQGKV